MRSLDDLRLEINEIDEGLSLLLKRRLLAARGVAEYKAANNLPICHKGREEEVVSMFASAFPEEEAPFARAFIKTVIRQSREFQYLLNHTKRDETSTEHIPGVICFPGISGSHSEAAAKKLYPETPLCACKTFSDVFAKINEDLSAVGVLPIDNSTAGTVGDVYDLLSENNLFIVRATTCAISHYLLATPGADISDIKFVHSHPQALAQCSAYLKSHDFNTVEAINTAIAAEYVSSLNDKEHAAIASIDTAKLYNLDVIGDKINNVRTNETRFICISKTPAASANANRMSLSFDLPNEPGALAEILSIFSDAGVNLTKILSRPIPTRTWEYKFFIDCIYTPGNASLYGLLTHLYAELPSVKLLGIYHEEESK